MLKTSQIILTVLAISCLLFSSWLFNHVSPMAGIILSIATLVAAFQYLTRSESVNEFKNKRKSRNEKI